MENNQLPNNENNVQPVAPVQPVTNQEQVVQPVTETQEVKPVEQPVEQKENKNEKRVVDTSFKNPDAFNSKEKVLFEAEPEKESNPVGTAIIFGILLFGLFMLPFADKLINRPNQNPDYGEIYSGGEEVIEDGLDDVFMFNTEQVSAGIGGLEFKNFVTSETETGYKIHFTIINNNDASYTYKKKYYMDFYEGENLLYHALIHSYKVLAAKGSTELSLEISKKAYERADSIKLVETKTTLYPKYEFNTKEGDYELLTCRYGKSEIVYYFKSGLLEKIRETYNNKDYESASYAQDKNEQQAQINKFKEVQGINANFVETDTEFTAQVDFELAAIQDSALTNLKVYRFFKYHEKGNIIAYEMPAMGYTCG